MMARINGHEVIPSAKRLIRSLRDLGYDFPTAVADLIDNSIEAGATQVAIDIEFNGDDSWVRIADNGNGMSLMQLQEAMRYGSEREYDDEEALGKFGLGLKTASMSQCQRMIVASRGTMKQREINAFCWDMDHVDATNRWEILRLPKRELNHVLDNHLGTTTGTVVFWQRLDRILGYKHPYGENAKKRLLSMCRDLEAHLGMVFHRFLSGEVRGRKIRITLNGNQVQSWDPFARTESKTRILESMPIRLEHEGKHGTVILEPYVLPHQDDFSTRDAFNRASGPKKWNRQQGFYIYRANRLIQSGGWSGLKTIDEHMKLARIAINFSPHLDDAFKINVAKMKVQLPMQIREEIDVAIKPATKLAQETYRKGAKKSVFNPLPQNPLSLPASTNPQIPILYQPGMPKEDSITHNTTQSGQVNRYWTLEELQGRLEKLAKSEEKKVLRNVFERLRKNMKLSVGNN